ncbi:MAG: hypothetical protein K8S97_06525, partial [Anaerolineae bacterium]|nr:hypothetical protein [Anaerolineae bacterium]
MRRVATTLGIAAVLLSVVVGFAVGLIISLAGNVNSSAAVAPWPDYAAYPLPTPAPPADEYLAFLDAEEAAVAHVYDTVGPSVVHITSRTEV